MLGLACWSAGCSIVVAPSFTVQKGNQIVATFRSDAQGRFDVPLAPGTYLIVPSQNAPIISPRSQAKQVVVGLDSTNVRLEFDTGIR